VKYKSLLIKLLVSMVLSAGLGLAGCASIDELKGTVSTWFSEASDRVPPEKMLSEDANKAPKGKDQEARMQNVEHPKKPPASVPAASRILVGISGVISGKLKVPDQAARSIC